MDGSQIMEAMVREGGCGSTWEDKRIRARTNRRYKYSVGGDLHTSFLDFEDMNDFRNIHCKFLLLESYDQIMGSIVIT